MKTVNTLFCLVLAHGITGHIFPKNHHQHQHQVNKLNYFGQHSSESSDSSYENSNEFKNKKIYQYENQDLHSNEFKNKKIYQYENQDLPIYKTKSQYEVNPKFGDSVVWKNIQVAVGPYSPVEDKDEIEKIFSDAQKTMKHATPEQKRQFHEVYESAIQEDVEDSHLNATQLLQKYQYPVEEHTIKTDDGYILTIFRIPPKMQTRDVQKRPVVFLMHTLLGSADDWLLMGSKKSLAYLLSDAGYDVWLGNARGNKYSRQHVSKHPALKDFWQFSNDEIALHDLPAMINYTLETTKQKKLNYIGHGQGVTVLLALTAAKPSYNEKIISMHALSPMVYMTNVRSPLIKMISPTSSFYERLHDQFGHGMFEPSKELIHTVGGSMCENEIGCKYICSNLNFVMAGVNFEGMQPEEVPMILEHLPAGTSTRTIKQYGQGVASHEFRKYDYGSQNNMNVYGSTEPPKYPMEDVQIPVVVYYSEEDWLAHPKDVQRLVNELPNVKETYKVPDEHFSHMDFQFSTKAPEIVYKKLIDAIQEYSY